MGFKSDLRVFNGNSRGFNGDLKGFNCDLKGFNGDLRGFNGDIRVSLMISLCFVRFKGTLWGYLVNQSVKARFASSQLETVTYPTVK